MANKKQRVSVTSTMNNSQRDNIARLFCAHFGNPYGNPRFAKAEGLYSLAHGKLPKGEIVEIGAYHGCGSVALAYGAGKGRTIYTIDDYAERTGWAGEHYGPEDRDAFYHNINAAGVQEQVLLLDTPVENAVRLWNSKIALLYWDLWGAAELRRDWAAWHDFIVPGGLFIVHEPGDRKWESDKLFARMEASGGWKYRGPLPGFLYVLERTA